MKLSILKAMGLLSILGSLVWWMPFPKTTDMLRPDFVASVAIGLGLVIAGVILFTVNRAVPFLQCWASCSPGERNQRLSDTRLGGMFAATCHPLGPPKVAGPLHRSLVDNHLQSMYTSPEAGLTIDVHT